ncbi:MAG: HD domain-containing protein [Candidatus Gastranaerophilales bacterium]|nr:HD domain-containing protein [Candidatus Gastranaerophilales bacterium]MCM1073349.1 HD domain-containing protein [Bacteroides sp.]
MRIVTSKELSTYKILPFDIYNELNQKILGAGEVLTPGKLIMLKNYPKIFTEEFTAEPAKGEKNSSGRATLKRLAGYSYDTLDIADFETVTNSEGTLKYDVQVKIKYYFKKTLDLFTLGYYEEGILKLNSLVSVIISDVFKQLVKSKKGSQVRFLGEYEICHPLNVAIISGLIAKKLEYSNQTVEQIIMAGLLHDIGKVLIKLSDGSSPLLTVNEDEVSAHTKLGYDLIKNKLHLSEEIATAALEHHENNDGTGYPQGFSNDTISEFAQIINVANYYDNLAYNRTANPVSTNREALRVMLEIGTKRFSAQMLYTFVHMFNYDDSKDFNDMIL